jgi:hypothetical protein
MGVFSNFKQRAGNKKSTSRSIHFDVRSGDVNNSRIKNKWNIGFNFVPL